MREVVHDEHLNPDHWWFRARRKIFARLLDGQLQLDPRGDVLDLGPGSGVNLPLFEGRGRPIVLDLARRSLLACRSAGAERAVQADATRLPFADDSFGLVCALDVLEHIPDDRAALAEIRRVLRPDGHLLLSAPAHRFLWGRQDVLSSHQRRYRRSELRERVEDAGFELRRYSYFNSILFAPIAAVRIAMRPFLGRTVEGGSDLAMKMPLGIDSVLYGTFASEAGWLVHRNLPLGVSLLGLARPRTAG